MAHRPNRRGGLTVAFASSPRRVDADVTIRDVSLRDGLQDEAPISTDSKLAVFDALVAAGVVDLELTSFVRPDRVPAMADAEQLAHATAGVAGVTRWGLVLNRRGAERALAAGLGHVQFVLSVSLDHNLVNAGRTVEQSFEELAAIVSLTGGAERGAQAGVEADVEVTLATSFGCPYAGPVDPATVLAAVDRAVELGAAGVSLADTIGTAIPSEVANLVELAVGRAGRVSIGCHLHDTRGLGVANALAAVGAGARRLDAALAGLGGCPFAPGASGNVAIEDLAHCLQLEGFELGLDVDALIDAAALACSLTGRSVDSHVGRAGRRFATREAT